MSNNQQQRQQPPQWAIACLYSFYADPRVFEVFTYPLIEGDPKTALLKNTNIVVTDKMARKYFGDESALGKTLLIDNEIPYYITGVPDYPDLSIRVIRTDHPG